MRVIQGIHDKELQVCVVFLLTGSDHAVAEAGDAHWLQLDPRLSVGVVERTHAARHRGGLPVSVTGHKKIKKNITMRADLTSFVWVAVETPCRNSGTVVMGKLYAERQRL